MTQSCHISWDIIFNINKTGVRFMRKADDILDYCIKNLKGTVLKETRGEKAVFYNPENILKKGVYVLTIKEKDGENDKASRLDRKNIFRVNLGLKKETFIKLFGEIPARPSAGNVVNMKYDFKKTDEVLPHPVYASRGWICILNPAEKTDNTLIPFINEAYSFAKEKIEKNHSKIRKKLK